VEEYEKFTGNKNSSAVFTGKPVGKGGSEGREEATGFGGFYVLEAALENKVVELSKNKTIAVQGFGNVSTFFVQKAIEKGFKIVALSDSKGGIYNLDGLHLPAVMEHKKKNQSLKDFQGARNVANNELLELDVDVLAPAALENVLTDRNAKKIKAKLIVELANGPTTREADKVFSERHIPVIPDILANSGGVCVSFYEWFQNMHNETWGKEQVLEKLEKQIKKAFEDVLSISEKYNTTFRNAAYILATERIMEKMTP